ncbi:hypothetical protein ACTMTI_07670 [Nonomuraea sp. H19]|uniref:hypothetical protein n=1 Tax=Nonomuraea sp. H19 TaxID=3452206 RepID=UPI003F8B28F5
MTQPTDEYGDLLRRALRAEADGVVPSPDGLEIIRARIERRGVRNLFWWRAGAAAASAVLVAGTIVMAVPELRSQIIEQKPVQQINDESSKIPSNSSTTRSQQPPSADPTHEQHPNVLPPEVSRTPSPRPAKTADSTSRPSPSPSPSPTPTSSECPSTVPVETAADCPTASPSPTPTDVEPTEQPSACPPEECPPDDATDGATELASPLVDVSPTTP